MKQPYRLLALCLALCLVAFPALGESAAFRVLDVPDTVTQPEVRIPFEGEDGISYALHYRYRNVWLQPMVQQLTGTSGYFDVTLGEGQNDFVLVESGQPRDASDAIPFTIMYASLATPTPQPTPMAVATLPSGAATPQPTQTPAETATPQIATQTLAPTPGPTAQPTPTPTAEPTPSPTPVPTPTPAPTPEPGNRVMSLWKEGNDVLALQEGLLSLKFNLGKADGVYGPRTRSAVMRFQRKYDLTADGLVGATTKAKLAELGVVIPDYEAPDLTLPDGFERILSIGKQGMDVHALQEALIAGGYLRGDPDQVYGVRTRAAVRAFQKDNGLKADGIAGPETLRLLMSGEAFE